MKAAISELEESLRILENNGPINRREGNIEQADLEAINACEIRHALTVLKAITDGLPKPDRIRGYRADSIIMDEA